MLDWTLAATISIATCGGSSTAPNPGGVSHLVRKATKQVGTVATTGNTLWLCGHLVESQPQSPLAEAVRHRICWAIEDEEAEGDHVSVTAEAQSGLLSLIHGVSQWGVADSVPVPHITVLGSGLMAEWRRDGRDLVLFVADDGSSKLHLVTIPEGQPVRQIVHSNPGIVSLVKAFEWHRAVDEPGV